MNIPGAEMREAFVSCQIFKGFGPTDLVLLLEFGKVYHRYDPKYRAHICSEPAFMLKTVPCSACRLSKMAAADGWQNNTVLQDKLVIIAGFEAGLHPPYIQSPLDNSPPELHTMFPYHTHSKIQNGPLCYI